MADTIVVSADDAAKAVADAKAKLEADAATKLAADKAAAIEKQAADELAAEAKTKADADAVEAARVAKLAPHTTRLDSLVVDGRITPAERKAVEQSIVEDKSTGALLDVLTQRPAGKGEQTHAQVGDSLANANAIVAERLGWPTPKAP